ncbi:MAG TPA: general secretion pathway protein GspB [Woeseiaceae bacterium]
MSFILDALKKSDAERQRKSTPGFADIPVAGDRKRPQRWVWIVGALLAVNLVVLIAVLIRPQERAAEVLTEPSVARTDSSVTTPADRSFSDYVAEAKKSRPEPARATTAPPRQAVVPSEAAPATTTAPTTTPAAARQSPVSSIAEDYSTFNSLRADGTLQLPDLHLDIHVYSDQANDRFVFINMKKYKEQATLTEGPAVKEITPNGVILEHAGTAFLLPRD